MGAPEIGEQCSRCRHLIGIVTAPPKDQMEGESRIVCDAFPKRGIPARILADRFDHRRPYPGDHGIRFEPYPGQKHPSDDVATG